MEIKPQYSVFKRKGKDQRFYRIKWINWRGRWQERKTRLSKKPLAEKEGHRLAYEAYEIRIGLRNPPLPQDHKKYAPLEKHIKDYLEWGRHHGGKNNKGWDEEHIRKVESQLEFWLKKSKWKRYLDINVVGAEKILQKKSMEVRKVKVNGQVIERKLAGKTINHYRTTFKAFVSWYRKFYQIKEADPLFGLTPWDVSVTDPRRDLSLEELGRLIKNSPPERAIIYLTAVITGLRREELRDLQDENYSYHDSCFKIDSDHNKEREDHLLIPLPQVLNEKLKKYISSRGKFPRLFNFDFNKASFFFDLDCKKAKIPKYSFGGKLVFHSLRDTQVNLGIDLGADLKTGMSLSRHATTDIYLSKYAKRKKDKILQVMEKIEDSITKEINS
jgi:integrase